MSTNSGEEPKIEVHSANSWETADLGDESRNNKFLRLMGAAKKEHHGRFVIGDCDSSQTHTDRAKEEDKKMDEKLAEQYEQSMEHRLAGGRKGHIGLGFHDDNADKPKDQDAEGEPDGETEERPVEEEDKAKSGEDGDKEKKGKGDGEDNENDAQENGEDKETRKRDVSESKEAEHHEDVKKMKFVKESS